MGSGYISPTKALFDIELILLSDSCQLNLRLTVLNGPTAVSTSSSCFDGISTLQDTDFILSHSLFPSLPKNNTFCKNGRSGKYL